MTATAPNPDPPATVGHSIGLSHVKEPLVASAADVFRLPSPANDEFSWQLSAEANTVRIRWFGLCVGYFLVNVLSPGPNRPTLNAILTLGAVYSLFDAAWSLQGRVFLGRVPLFISLMEAAFIGVLCHFDEGVDSPFRFYYFLSLLVCAIRYSPWVTYSTLGLHAASYVILAFTHGDVRETHTAVVLMLIFMAWVTWAGTALVSLLKTAREQMAALNDQLRINQMQLEDRIHRRTRELQESQALLVQQEKQAAFGLLAAGIAHEVGNPLAAISSLVQLVNRRDLDEYMHEKLGLIDEQLLRIQRTLRELVEFSRPGTTIATTCDINEVIESSLSIAKYYKRKKGKTIVTHYTDGLPSIRIVRDRLVQVFLNLVLNALDATEEGAQIEIRTSLEDDHLAIDLRDEGSGIPIETQKRLFAPYISTKPTGTGLGLFVCRNILAEFHGTIQLVESSPAGTTFRVLLPITPPETGRTPPPGGTLGPAAWTMSSSSSSTDH